MLSSLLRPRRGRKRIDQSPFSSPFTGSPQDTRRGYQRGRAPTTSEDAREQGEENDEDVTYDELDEEEDEDEDDEPLLPIFSAAHLDALPVYQVTHAIRMLIVQKCETTLTWDQLRSPQVSQFLVKPIQLNIRSNHFNRATLTALLANCLQFRKEAEINPGNAGVNKTRALFAELLALRLLREYSTRELIDALSYDFDPLQGMDQDPPAPGKPVARKGIARLSTVEIAIRATAKKFLAHPLVVQQLEAIWAGSIVFHSAADNLHRKPSKPVQSRFHKQRGYGTIREHSPRSPRAGPINGAANGPVIPAPEPFVRRSVTLYDPREASLFKLSRLRVPRYRQIFSTLSFGVMLALYLAVLVERKLHITPLEILFWIYSLGYMLDEVVGFTEQGFGLYIISVWNAFDLGILFAFFIYYVLRLYAILMPDDDRRKYADMAYDVLAASAVLLFPRAFSVLDHYRYFSQLLIAFRMMAQDLVAIMILIAISCSGFFVAFAFAFSDENTNNSTIVYAIFQMIMGFTPAAWNVWDSYSYLGRVVLTLFLFLCHFLIVTILVTVLTNSFMAIVQNANEEHQFLFAVNTISMVKSDALFSYIAPTNVISWFIAPMRYLLPFRQFVKLNRTVIKVTHLPILFTIFAYERVILSRLAYDPAELVEQGGKEAPGPVAFSKAPQIFLPRNRRLREPSVVSFKKDQVLEEVFRRPFRDATVRTTNGDEPSERRKSSNVVDTWMQNVGKEGGASPPMEQPRSVLDRLESRRPGFRRAMTADRLRIGGRRDYSTATRSVLSDPEDRPLLAARRPRMIAEEGDVDMSLESIVQETEGEDGDDELMTHDEADHQTVEKSSIAIGASPKVRVDKENVPLSQSPADYFDTPTAARPSNAALPNVVRTRPTPGPQAIPKRSHDRVVSSGTVLFQPHDERISSSSEAAAPPPPRPSRPAVARAGTATPNLPVSGYRTPRPNQPAAAASRARPILPARGIQTTAPDLRQLTGLNFDNNRRFHREPSFNTLALDLASELGDNKFGPALVDVGGISGMPASFSEQMLREREFVRRQEDDRRRKDTEDKERINRLVLNRMSTLEEGFREVISAVREIRNESRAGTGSEGRAPGGGGGGSERPKLARTGTGLLAGQGSSGQVTAASSVIAPRTPGRKEPVKEKKSPKKIKRPSVKEVALPLAAAAAAQEEEGPRSAGTVVEGGGGGSTEGRGEGRGESRGEGRGEGWDGGKGQGKGKQREDESPNSVKSIVQTLERKESQRRGSSQGARRSLEVVGERSFAAVAAAGVEGQEGQDGGDGEGQEEARRTVGSRRPRAPDEGDKRASVIYVGKEPLVPRKEEEDGEE